MNTNTKGGYHSKNTKVVKFHNFGPDPPPLKLGKPQFFFTPCPKNHFMCKKTKPK